MRARNPCLLIRLRLRGRYDGFMRTPAATALVAGDGSAKTLSIARGPASVNRSRAGGAEGGGIASHGLHVRRRPAEGFLALLAIASRRRSQGRLDRLNGHARVHGNVFSGAARATR